MSTTEANEVAAIVERVQSWPVPVRITLVRRILETVDRADPGASVVPPPRGPSAAEVSALFKDPGPPPDVGEDRQILEEELLRKYGR